jgi:hypothetical protein
MFRGAILLAFSVASAAIVLNYGAQYPDLANGFWRLASDLDHILILGAISVAAIQLPRKTRWLTFGAALAIAVLAAYLTTRGLELPERQLTMMLALFVIGAIGASSGSLLVWLGPFAALATLFVGHAATDARPNDNLMFLSGLGLSALLLLLLGAAVADIADSIDSGLTKRLAAGISGAGAYLLLQTYVV